MRLDALAQPLATQNHGPSPKPHSKPPKRDHAMRASLALIAYDLTYWLLPPLRPWLERTFPGF